MSTYRLHLGDKFVETLRLRSATDRVRLDHRSHDASSTILELAVLESALKLVLIADDEIHSTLEIPVELEPYAAEGVQVTLEDAGDPARLSIGFPPISPEQPPARLYATYIWPAGTKTFSLAILRGSDHVLLLPRLEGPE